MNYNEALQFLRQKFLDDNQGLLKKYEKYKATGTHSGNAMDFFREHDVFDMLSVLEKNTFVNSDLLAAFEELLFVAQNIGYRGASFDVRDYLKDGTTINQESLSKDMKEMAEILLALDIVETQLKEDLKGLGVKVKDPDEEWYEELLKAVHRGKNRKLELKGDEEFLISKIRVNGGGFKFSDDMQMDDRIFYTDIPEHIIEMARVSKPGVYIIASIPKGDLYRSGFYLLFVSKGDAFLVDNNVHSCREFITRNPDRLMERRTNGVWFPWGVIEDFLDKKSETKAIALTDSKFTFRSIGQLSKFHPVVVMWVRAFIDTCLQTFRDTSITKRASPSVSMGILEPTLLDDKTSKALVPYAENLPALKKEDIEWDPKVVGCDQKGTKTSLEVMLRDVPMPTRPSDTLMPMEEVRRHMMWARRQAQADKLGESLKRSWKKKGEAAFKQVRDFVRSKFESDMKYWIGRAFENKKYPVRVYRQFTKKSPKDIDEFGSWTEDKDLFHEHGKHSYIGLYSHTIRLEEYTHGCPGRSQPCLCCDKMGRFRFTLTFLSADQFALFFNIKKGERKQLPKEFWQHFHREGTRYDGNSILDDMDPVHNVKNPWWVFGGGRDPELRVLLYLCGFCRKKFYKESGRECPSTKSLRE